MTSAELTALLRDCPLIASAQASPGPLQDPDTLVRIAQASMQEGVKVIRLEGTEMAGPGREKIRTPNTENRTPVTIGLIKKHYPGTDVYITPTSVEVDALLAAGCEVIGLEGSSRPRHNGDKFEDLVARIHAGGAMVMADCDTPESVAQSVAAGVELIGTTLAGYTEARPMSVGPDFDMLRQAIALAPGRVIAEGRYAEPWQAQAALAMGAIGVTIGAALNDIVRLTQNFVRAMQPYHGPVGAVDIGGTWIRFAVFQDGELTHIIREPLPQDRLGWIAARLAESGVKRLGISTGGTVHDNVVTEASDLIPGYVGTKFEFPGVEVFALNDGLATAWAHGLHYGGQRVATLAIGTGLGFGIVDRGRLLMGRNGEYPRLNNRAFSGGGTLEEAVGGGFRDDSPLTPLTSAGGIDEAVRLIQELYYPDVIVRCGGVGLANDIAGTVPSPFGENAGLMGAAMLAKWPMA
ncbi:MAG: putative N-acetylmannosamine-6-phosphate 2-epimerase [Chthonomonas sp.]|nr:putative N-acetylmannosamine-6-phosphate 2-epimerase [Chthonomonas sp.]